jgi:hypothetical protein
MGFYYSDPSDSSSPPVTPTTPVWKVDLPIIADFSEDAAPCPHTPIPPILVTFTSPYEPKHLKVLPTGERDIRVVGFVEAYLFDADIGRPPPSVSGSCASEPNRADPWGFTVNGTPTNCNSVRARLSCNSFFYAASNNLNPIRVWLVL